MPVGVGVQSPFSTMALRAVRNLGIPDGQITISEEPPSPSSPSYDGSFRIACTRCAASQTHKHGRLLPLELVSKLVTTFAQQHVHGASYNVDPLAAMIEHESQAGRPITAASLIEERDARARWEQNFRERQQIRTQEQHAIALARRTRDRDYMERNAAHASLRWEREQRERYRRAQQQAQQTWDDDGWGADDTVEELLPASPKVSPIPIADDEGGRKVRF